MYGYLSSLLGNAEEAERGMERTLELLKTEQDKNKMMDAIQAIIQHNLYQIGVDYLERFMKLIKDKSSYLLALVN